MEHHNNQEISIRLAQPADDDVIVQLQLISIKTLCAQDYNPKQLNALLHSKSCYRYWDENIFIAEIGELIVGFAALQKHSFIIEPILGYRYTISAMFVHPQYTRQKIGTKLLLHIEQIVIQKRIKHLFVYSSLTGQKFYTNNGFITIGKHYLSLQDNVIVPCIKMGKRLLVNQEEKSNDKLINNKALKRELITKLLPKILIYLPLLLLLIL